MSKELGITIFFLSFLVLALFHKSIPRVNAEEGEINIVVEPPSVNILDVDVKQDTISIETSEGDIDLILDRKIPGGFKHKLRENFFQFGYGIILPQEINVSVTIQSEIPLNNTGCLEMYHEWVCDEDFSYKELDIELDDLLFKNPNMTLNITKNSDYNYDLELLNIQNFDPIVSADNITYIIGGSHTCESLATDIGAEYFQCGYSGEKTECNMSSIWKVVEGATVNISNCTLYNNMGDQEGLSQALIAVNDSSSFYIENGGIESTVTTYDHTIWIDYDSSSFHTLDSNFSNMGRVTTGQNEQAGFLIEIPDTKFYRNTFTKCQWCLTMNKQVYGDFPNYDGGHSIIENNSFITSSTAPLILFGSSNNNITNNLFSDFSGYIFFTTKNVTGVGAGQYSSDNNTFSKNYITGGAIIDTLLEVDIATCENCSHNVFNGNYFHDSYGLARCNKHKGGIFALGKYNNYTDNRFETIGGLGGFRGAICNGDALTVRGEYNYINGTDCDALGGANCDDSVCIILNYCDNCTIENSVDLTTGATDYKSCGAGIRVDSNSADCLIDENYLDIMDGDADMVRAIDLDGDNNIIRELTIIQTKGGGEGITIEGSGNTLQNIECSVSSLDYDCINFDGGENNLIQDSNLTCTGSCGTDGGACDPDNFVWTIAGDPFDRCSDAGTFRNTLLNTSYTNWCGTGGFGGDLYELEVQWYLDVEVTDNIGVVMDEVALNLSNLTNYKLSDDLTNSKGIKKYNVTQYVQNDTDIKYDQTPLYLNASREDTGVNNSRIPFTTNTLWGITLFADVRDTWNYFYFFMFVFPIFLIILSRKLEDYVWSMVAGFLWVATAIVLLREGHPAVTDTFMLTFMWIILFGLGVYFILDSAYKMLQQGGYAK